LKDLGIFLVDSQPGSSDNHALEISHAMQRHGNQLLYSPSDLGNFVACEHLTQLEFAAVLGESTRPYFSNAYVDLIARKGEEHEKNFLEALRAEGHEVAEVGLGDDRSFAAAAETTAAAMRAGSKYIYQAVFLTDDWRGIADFLERIDRPSALGEWSYQVLDTKLARHPRPEHALQLCFYSHALGQIQGIAPKMAYVVLGTREPSRSGSQMYRLTSVDCKIVFAKRSRPARQPLPSRATTVAALLGA